MPLHLIVHGQKMEKMMMMIMVNLGGYRAPLGVISLRFFMQPLWAAKVFFRRKQKIHHSGRWFHHSGRWFHHSGRWFHHSGRLVFLGLIWFFLVSSPHGWVSSWSFLVFFGFFWFHHFPKWFFLVFVGFIMALGFCTPLGVAPHAFLLHACSMEAFLHPGPNKH